MWQGDDVSSNTLVQLFTIYFDVSINTLIQHFLYIRTETGNGTQRTQVYDEYS